MAKRPLKKQNWQARKVNSQGPKFRIDVANPQMGLNGTDVYNIYGVTDNKDVSLVGLAEGGTFHLYNDRSIEIIAGQKNETNGVDIVITGRSGDICITAEKNGRIRIRGQNIMIDADEDLDIRAGRNITLDSGSGRILLHGNTIDADGLDGNLVPSRSSFGEQVFAGTYVASSLIKKTFFGGVTSILGI